MNEAVLSSGALDVLASDKAEIVELCSGQLKDGREFYAFIQMTVESYRSYREALKQSTTINLPSYGIVLHTGWGAKPDVKIAESIMKNHTDNFRILEWLYQTKEDIKDE
jgi:hypothetical protein